MMLKTCASLRSVRPCGVRSGVHTWSWVQQACMLRLDHTRQATSKSGARQAATTGSNSHSSSHGGCGSDAHASSRGRQLLRQQHTSRGLQRVAGASGFVSVVAAAAARPEGAAAPAALHPTTSADLGPTLHKPYSHFFQGHLHWKARTHLSISGSLCTDIEALQFSNGSCPVQVSVLNHPADWDFEGYVLQHPIMQHQQALQQRSAAQASKSAAGSTQAVGPFEAVLNYREGGQLVLTGLPFQMIRQVLAVDAAPHAVVLQERLISSERPQFLLHTMPTSLGSNQPYRNGLGKMINRAGEGPGLQIFPGSVPVVAPAGRIHSKGSQRGGYTIPRVLICSQLPANITYPLALTLTLMDSPGQQGQSSRQLGQWQVNAYKDDSSITLGMSQILAKYVGYSIAKASLLQDPTQGARLTLTLADTVDQP